MAIRTLLERLTTKVLLMFWENNSLRLWSFFGFPLYLHFSFFLFFAAIWLLMGLPSVGYCLLSFLFVTVHEYGHALTGKYLYNSKVKDITLFPLGGAARVQIPEDPKGEIVVVAAGPATNLVMLSLAVGLLNVPYIPGEWEPIIVICAFFNAIIFAFNLLPIYPMDGGRLLRASLTWISGDRLKATRIAVTVGQLLAAFLMGFCFYLGLPLIGLIFMFIIFVSMTELKALESKAEMDRARLKLAELLKRPELATEAEDGAVQLAFLTAPDEVVRKLVNAGLHRPFLLGEFTDRKTAV